MSNTTKFCPFCGEPVAENIVVCPHCGEAVIYSPKNDRQIFRTAKRLLSDSYELLEAIEQDGKYIRYKAVRRKDDTPVTISILNTDQVNSYSEIEFFLWQNKITARLKHKHILPVYDYGVIKGLPYAVTPYLQEKSLKEILKQSRSLPESECVEIIKEVATALDYAHKQGIIHGHLTPERIFYSNDKQVYVSGFAYEGQNVSMGFPEINPYMSPEQIKGDAFDIKADMYALAIIFYICLNGHLPESLRSAKKRLTFYYKQDLFSFIKNDPSIKSFKTFFQKALARDRAKRYKSLGNFTRALTQRRAACPICGTTKPVERFTCPECKREHICIDHRTRDGICTECARNAEETKQLELAREKARNLQKLKQSGLIEKFVEEHNGQLTDVDYQWFIEHHGYSPIDNSAVRQLLEEAKKQYTPPFPVKGSEPDKPGSNRRGLYIGVGVLALFVIIALLIIRNSNKKTTNNTMPASVYERNNNTSSSTYDDRAAEKKREREQMAERLYQQALSYIEKNKLTSPSGACALAMADKLAEYDTYKSGDIRNRIAQKYKDWATANYNKGNYERALNYFKKSQSIVASDYCVNMIDQLKRRIKETRVSAKINIPMVYVQGGTFKMGDTWGDGGSDEKPVHTVTVRSFYMGKYEVTNAQVVDVFNWALAQGKISATSFTVKNTEGNQHQLLDLDNSYCQISYDGSRLFVENNYDNYPVIEITWYGAAAFCNYLSEREGLTPVYDLNNWTADWNANGYRLPTEAEWEYAAKGGANGNYTKYSGSDNPDDVAWYWGNSNASGNSNLYKGQGTLPIGIKSSNELGLYDMSGNVWEWCQDWYVKDYYSYSPRNNPKGPSYGASRVLRGGGWGSRPNDVRCSFRNNYLPDVRYYIIGFRILISKN